MLPEAFARDAQRMARFEREAELLASLNHPRIAAIYGLEKSGDVKFIVQELVPGETLADILKRGALSFPEAVAIAGQIAEAVAAAHDSGVIHRDLKPANIKITPEGDVKVLDFGLAKAFTDEPADVALSQSPTLSAHATRAGAILGTAAYMSPEQARGRRVDKRSDVFSFGAVLYEMLTGRQLFQGEDVADTMASVIKSEPDLQALPSGVRELLARCLEKDPRKRRRDIGDLGFELEALLTRPSPSSSLPTIPRRFWLISAAAVIGLSAAVGFVTWQTKPTPPRPLRRFEIAPPEDSNLSNTSRHALALSPLGTHLVYNANGQLFLRQLDQTDAVPIRGTENASEPFFSPDGGWIGFLADGYLKKIPTSGGTPITLCEAESSFGASWAADGTIVFSQGEAGIFEVPANGGEPRPLVAGLEGLAVGPRKLDGGKVLLFTLGEGSVWDEASIVVERLDTGERKTLIRGGADARYLPTGHLVYVEGTTLFAVFSRFPAPVKEVKSRAMPDCSRYGLRPARFSMRLSLVASSRLRCDWSPSSR